MSTGEITARHYRTGQAQTIRFTEGRISAIEPARSAPENLFIVPPLFDLQVNGYAGIDYQAEKITADELLLSVRKLRANACPHIFLTLITDEWPRLIERLSRIHALREKDPELRAAIAGYHIEGPFMSDQPGFHGAHNPAFMRDGTPQHLADLRAAVGNAPVLLTIAPERNGAIEFVRAAVAQDFRISLGHTDASLEQLNGAIAAGATAFTHLGNATPPELSRADNILWRVFNTKGLTAGIIPDTMHVTPDLFRIMHRLLDRIYYTTDCMSAAGAPPGLHPLGKIKLEVGPDEVVRVPGKKNFAGSALRPFSGVQRAMQMLSAMGKSDWRDVWDRFSIIPRNLMRLSPVLAVKAEASFCVVEVNGETLSGNGRVFFQGQETALVP